MNTWPYLDPDGPDPFVAVEAAMLPAERRMLLDEFVRLNPRWRGAQVADVLSELGNADSHLDLVEPLFEAHSLEIGDDRFVGIVTGAAIRAMAIAYGVREDTEALWFLASGLVRRAREQVVQVT